MQHICIPLCRATLSDLTVTVYNINEPAGKEKWEQLAAETGK